MEGLNEDFLGRELIKKLKRQI